MDTPQCLIDIGYWLLDLIENTIGLISFGSEG